MIFWNYLLKDTNTERIYLKVKDRFLDSQAFLKTIRILIFKVEMKRENSVFRKEASKISIFRKYQINNWDYLLLKRNSRLANRIHWKNYRFVKKIIFIKIMALHPNNNQRRLLSLQLNENRYLSLWFNSTSKVDIKCQNCKEKCLMY